MGITLSLFCAMILPARLIVRLDSGSTRISRNSSRPSGLVWEVMAKSTISLEDTMKYEMMFTQQIIDDLSVCTI